MIALVGYTGFVGSNIYYAAQDKIDAVYNSQNVVESYGKNPDVLIYAGLRAEKYLANNEPEKDMERIKQAEENIARINPKKLILISTIDVFKIPKNVDENSEIDTVDLHPYGYNRYQLELWTRKNYPDALIIRLPGLFGKNIKKNFIYDFMNVIPFMLKEDKLYELSLVEPSIMKYYIKQNNGFFKICNLSAEEKSALKAVFKRLGFSALYFTDSRSRYQFYNLEQLWNDIHTALRYNIMLWHPATEPVSAREVYEYLTKESFVNELEGVLADYDYKTCYADVFGGTNGYICSKKAVLEQIKKLVENSEERI